METSSDILSEFVHYRTYARWLEEQKRREFPEETIDRYLGYLHGKFGDKIESDEWNLIRSVMKSNDAVGSLRLMWSAGKAHENEHIAGYNCAYVTLNNLMAFSETLYILMCGTGVGYSVEEQFVSELPRIRKQRKSDAPVEVFQIPDSKLGWAQSLEIGLKAWYNGDDIKFDYSLLRPAGAILKTFGGRSSGPDPLRDLLDFTRMLVISRQGKRLTPFQCHSLMCKIAEIVVVGGVRRSSLISLSDLDDREMRDCKKGQFWTINPHLSMANNSSVYEGDPSDLDLLEEWGSLIESQSGERGIFVRDNALITAPRRKKHPHFGCNPCAEINLLPMEFCNLSEATARRNDTFETLQTKIWVATVLGTLQSTFTDFNYLRPEWKANCDEERLLGVSITGIMDSPAVRNPEILGMLKQVAIGTNQAYAERLGINQAAAVTCIKPSGTNALRVNSSSGLHTRWAKFYVRRVRISATDPLLHLARVSNVPCIPENDQDPNNPMTWVLEFPQKSPDGAITRHDVTALDQLELWKLFKTVWCEHNPSATEYVSNNEWIEVLAWLKKNWKIIGGLSFLPKHDYVYRLAPYEEISEKDYYERVAQIRTIDYTQLHIFENKDMTTGSKEYACTGGQCEI